MVLRAFPDRPPWYSRVSDFAGHTPLRKLANGWAGLTLARQFLVAGSAVLIAGMLVIGIWVTRQIEEGVISNSASATALYVDSVIAPLFPNLGGSDVLSEGARRALDESFSQGELGSRLAFFKLWLDDGLVAYSSEPALIGKRFELTDNLKEAWTGHVAAEFNELSEEENRSERTAGLPLLEIYSPIREPWSGKVVAVAEFYEIARDLEDSLDNARLRSWLVVALVTLCMMGLLSGIVFRGSHVITHQRRALEQRVSQLSQLLAQNEHLRLRVQGASGRAAALNERYLRRISADLHDGPAQLLALASLRLGSASIGVGPDTEATEEIKRVRSLLDEAMRDVRNISRGLTLPEIERMDLSALLGSVVRAHEQRTAVSVDLTDPGCNPPLSQSEKICVYRFVQEGLNNASRHAAGAAQHVAASFSICNLQVTIADEGPGFDMTRVGVDGLGIAGLRERVASLGGDFLVESSPAGTRLTLTLNVAKGDS